MINKRLHLFVCITVSLFPALLLSSCRQNDKSLYDFLYESLEDYILTEISPDNIQLISDKKVTLDNNINENYSFTFDVVREKNLHNTEINCKNKTFENFSFQKNDMIFLKEIITPVAAPVPLYLSLYRESELIIQQEADEGLCFSNKIFQFPGKYILTVTFQTNQIIQEACFQIEIN
jgi:hypothetical protein